MRWAIPGGAWCPRWPWDALFFCRVHQYNSRPRRFRFGLSQKAQSPPQIQCGRGLAMDGLRVRLNLSGQFQDADIAQVAIAFRVVQAVADHEFVRNLKTDIVRPDL